MAVTKINGDDFSQIVLKEQLPVIVDFYADWCGPCQAFGPIFEKVSDKFIGKVKFIKLNVEEGQEIAANYGVMSIPTIIIFRDGKPLETLTGLQNEESLIEKLSQGFK